MLRLGSQSIVLVAALATGCVSPPAPAAPPTEPAPLASSPSPAVPAPSDMLAKALPAVVLVVTQRPNGEHGFGSGILLARDHVLTARHVVDGTDRVSVMFYDPSRASYGGLESEGGLRRYLFEHLDALVPAEVVRKDAGLDLATLHVPIDTSKYPRLVWREEPARIGERVYAVGHPGQNVWSFTTGQISNAHVDALQVDAAINEGNSGGPLLDERGQMLGINLLRAAGGNQSIGYARPVTAARRFFQSALTPSSLDLSTPEAAIRHCLHAAHERDPQWAECTDDLSELELLGAAKQRALSEIGRPTVLSGSVTYEQTHVPYDRYHQYSRLERSAWLRTSGLPIAPAVLGERIDEERLFAKFVEMKGLRQSSVDLFAREGSPYGGNPFTPMTAPELLSLRKRIARATRGNGAREAAVRSSIARRTGLQPAQDFHFLAIPLDTLKRGLRIEKVVQVSPSRAWASIAGLNPDGTPYRLAQLWVERGRVWREHRVPLEADLATRPADFPSTPFAPDGYVAWAALEVLSGWERYVTSALTRASAPSSMRDAH